MTAGFQHYVTKPVEPDELAAAVANLAGRLDTCLCDPSDEKNAVDARTVAVGATNR